MMSVDLKDVLVYALGGQAPEGFLDHLIRHRQDWDEQFKKRLDDFAYELRPDLAVWELTVDTEGRLFERRVSLLS